MDFSSVNDFLRQVSSAKGEGPECIDAELDPILSDPAVVGVTTELGDTIEDWAEKYGDEAYKQIGIFCLGRWVQIHQEALQEHVVMESIDSALVTMNDIALLCTAIEIATKVGSFGGDEDWRKMLKQVTERAALEKLGENGLDWDLLTTGF